MTKKIALNKGVAHTRRLTPAAIQPIADCCLAINAVTAMALHHVSKLTAASEPRDRAALCCRERVIHDQGRADG